MEWCARTKADRGTGLVCCRRRERAAAAGGKIRGMGIGPPGLVSAMKMTERGNYEDEVDDANAGGIAGDCRVQ